MVDVVLPETRSRMMAGIKGKHTKPELAIRSGLHRSGFRFRLHRSDLPGRPDLVFPKHRAVIHVNGCFWHGHGCHLFKWPSSRPEFWKAKIAGNRARDERNATGLSALGWRRLVVWECALKGRMRHSTQDVVSACAQWLASGASSGEIAGDEKGLSVRLF